LRREAVHAERMRTGIGFSVTPRDRLRLDAIVGDRNAKQKYVKRAKVILATADGCGTNEIIRRSELRKPVVWRWQKRFMHEGRGWAPAAQEDTQAWQNRFPPRRCSVSSTLRSDPRRMLAKAAGVSLRSVQRRPRQVNLIISRGSLSKKTWKYSSPDSPNRHVFGVEIHGA
jgi:hypothetical protein